MNIIIDDLDMRVLERALDRAAVEVEREVMRGLSQGAEIVAEEARTNHEYVSRSGRLERNTVDVPAQRKGGMFEAAVAAHTPYAAAIEGGAAPHGIAPRRKGGMLKFRYAGRWISKRFVQHPGNKAYHFLQNAIDRKLGVVEDVIEAAALRGLARAGFEVAR